MANHASSPRVSLVRVSVKPGLSAGALRRDTFAVLAVLKNPAVLVHLETLTDVVLVGRCISRTFFTRALDFTTVRVDLWVTARPAIRVGVCELLRGELLPMEKYSVRGEGEALRQRRRLPAPRPGHLRRDDGDDEQRGGDVREVVRHRGVVYDPHRATDGSRRGGPPRVS